MEEWRTWLDRQETWIPDHNFVPFLPNLEAACSTPVRIPASRDPRQQDSRRGILGERGPRFIWPHVRLILPTEVWQWIGLGGCYVRGMYSRFQSPPRTGAFHIFESIAWFLSIVHIYVRQVLSVFRDPRLLHMSLVPVIDLLLRPRSV